MPPDIKITLLMAITVDGKIGRNSDHFPDWTGKADKQLFARLSRQAGVVIMGSKTFDTFNTPLPGRKNVIMTRNRERKSRWSNLVYTTESPAGVLAGLAAEGHSHAILAGGAKINTLFARAGLVDEVMVTIAPKIFGCGLSLFEAEVALELELTDVQKVDRNMVWLTYRIIKPDTSATYSESND